MWNPHPKQKEFLESKEKRVFYSGGSPAGASCAWVKKLFLERRKMTKNDLENKLSDIAMNVEELSSKLKVLSDEVKDILRDIENIDLDELKVEKETDAD